MASKLCCSKTMPTVSLARLGRKFRIENATPRARVQSLRFGISTAHAALATSTINALPLRPRHCVAPRKPRISAAQLRSATVQRCGPGAITKTATKPIPLVGSCILAAISCKVHSLHAFASRALLANPSLSRTHGGVPPFAPPFHSGPNAATPQCAG